MRGGFAQIVGNFDKKGAGKSLKSLLLSTQHSCSSWEREFSHTHMLGGKTTHVSMSLTVQHNPKISDCRALRRISSGRSFLVGYHWCSSGSIRRSPALKLRQKMNQTPGTNEEWEYKARWHTSLLIGPEMLWNAELRLEAKQAFTVSLISTWTTLQPEPSTFSRPEGLINQLNSEIREGLTSFLLC